MSKGTAVLAFVLGGVAGLGAGWGFFRGATPVPSDDPAHPPEARLEVSNQALANFGVEIGEAELSDQDICAAVPAQVVKPPLARQAVFSHFAGHVLTVEVHPGMTVRKGQMLATVLREAIARPGLASVAGALESGRAAWWLVAVELAEAERRLRALESAAPADRRAVEEARRVREQAAREMAGRGFTEAQIEASARGEPPPGFSAPAWKRLLERAGLWTEAAERLHAAFPPVLQESPWGVAVAGELAATGLASAELVGWLQGNPSAGARALEIASLLQRGETLMHVQHLHEMGALEPLVRVAASSEGEVPDWDVEEVHVVPGTNVAAESPLFTLVDARQMLLRAELVSAEAGWFEEAIEKGWPLSAEPLARGDGPPLAGLKVTHLVGTGAGRAHAFLPVRNVPLAAEGSAFRTWRLREGQPYVLQVPRRRLSGVFVLPAEAVIEEGIDQVVLVQNGRAFEPRKVVVLHRNAETAILDGKRSDLFPGDPVVRRGAFALGQALKKGVGTADPHAECSHAHPHPH